ncbi:MAG: SHOCT domain-containing protein [Gemmatimonadetes bacterium]|jgi:putative membrane protein|nr:SHOCT domain-containing protein [Gemmatimonadota bacterium]
MHQLLTIADYYGGGHMDWGGGWWIAMVIAMVLFWGLVAYWLVRAFGSRRDQRPGPGSSDALEILDCRLAEGEISPEEYRERRSLLARTAPDDPKQS